MALQFSGVVRNARLDAIETAIGVSAKLMMYTGSMPANCAASTTGTKVVEFDLASDWAAAASAGAKSLSSTPISASAAASGTPGYFRLFASDGTTCHAQGLTAQPWAASTAWVLNQQVVNNGLVYRCSTAGTSASSGGPTGTGSGITDGTAVWLYVGTGDMTVDNTTIVSGQAVNVTGFTVTDGNA